MPSVMSSPTGPVTDGCAKDRTATIASAITQAATNRSLRWVLGSVAKVYDVTAYMNLSRHPIYLGAESSPKTTGPPGVGSVMVLGDRLSGLFEGRT